MPVTESIAELRRICQYTRYDDYGKIGWPEKIFRSISIYFTKLFLQIGISANQASLIGLLITIIGGAFLLFPSPGYWLIGIALLLLYQVTCLVDGEIARYNKTASPKGAFCNSMPEQFSLLYIPICISFGIYNSFHSIYPFIIGFLVVTALYISSYLIPLTYKLLHERGLLAEVVSSNQAARSQEHIIIRYARIFNHEVIMLLAFLVSTIVDFFISPFAIGSLSFNARYISFIAYTLLWLAGAIRNIYLLFHSRLTSQL